MIFISYRHEDSHVVRALQVALEAHFDERFVLRDIKSFSAGEDLRHTIVNHLQQARTVLVIVGSSWMRDDPETGRPRLEQAGDWIRFELSLALAWRKDIIPILVDDAIMPDRSVLPGDIADFADRLALRLRDSDWNVDMSTLFDRIDPSRQRRSESSHMSIENAGPVAGRDVTIEGETVAGRDLVIGDDQG